MRFLVPKSVKIYLRNTHLETNRDLLTIDATLARNLLPDRPADAHKGTFGHVVVVAGSPGFTGAACMCGEAALRSGTGLVTLAVPASLNLIFEVKLTEVMTRPVSETTDGCLSDKALPAILSLCEKASGVAIGPGIGRHPQTQSLVLALLKEVNCPMVLDADGLNLLASAPEGVERILKSTRAPVVLTPHPGEMSRLTGLKTSEIQATRVATARKFAAVWGQVVVLKGASTVVASPDGWVGVNTSGNSGLATGGTGDVLTGLIAGFLAQGLAPKAAATLGVYLHGLAGDLAADALTQRAMIAGDLLRFLPAAFKQLES